MSLRDCPAFAFWSPRGGLAHLEVPALCAATNLPKVLIGNNRGTSIVERYAIDLSRTKRVRPDNLCR